MREPNRADGPHGDTSRHLPLEALEEALAQLSPPQDVGELAWIVSRGEGGVRGTPRRTTLDPETGVPGDAWLRSPRRKPDAQISLMRVDVAELFANGQPLTLFGDNLLVALDLSRTNLPTGSQLRIGDALLEVTPEPHDGCTKFRQRFGAAALRCTAAPHLREQRLRGIYARVVRAGAVAVGDAVQVLARGEAG